MALFHLAYIESVCSFLLLVNTLSSQSEFESHCQFLLSDLAEGNLLLLWYLGAFFDYFLTVTSH